MTPIIKSILDSDLYKFTMQVAVIKHFPRLKVRYNFTDRNNTVYPDGFDKLVMSEIKEMEKLYLTSDEKIFLTEKCGSYLPPTYIDFLNGYKFDSNEVSVKLNNKNNLSVTVEGYWYRTILWEVPIMAVISELYFREIGQTIDIDSFNSQDIAKLQMMIDHNAFFCDMGARRRYSFDNQERIVKLFSTTSNNVFVGTSNVYLAFKQNTKPIGSIAHEFFMVIACVYGVQQANKIAMDLWLDTYKYNQLGTILPDTFTLDYFLKSFEYKYASNFNSIRHDSGDPYIFSDKVIDHYKSLNIDPMTKTIIFSDGLDVETSIKIKEYCVGKIKSSFGIGTNLTNNVGAKPLNMVIKISEVLVDDCWIDAVKLSDNKGKHTGKPEEIELYKNILKIK